MSSRVSLLQRTVLSALLALGLLGFYSALDSAGQEKTTPPSDERQQPVVINVKELSPERFRELFPSWPDDTVLESNGKRITVGELRAKSEQRQAVARSEHDQSLRKAVAELERRRAAFRESEKARLDARNKETMAQFERLPKRSPELQAELQAIRREFLTLKDQWTKASPAERDEILRRADELVHKYDRLTPSAAQ